MLHDNRGSGISDNTGIVFQTPDTYADTIVDATYTYGTPGAKMNLELAASYLDKSYTNHEELTQYFDYTQPELGATFFYRVMPKTDLLLQARYNDVSYDTNRPFADKLDSSEQNYQIGVTWDATAKTTGIAKVGYLIKDFDSPSYNSHEFPSWEVAVDWSPRKRTTFNLTTNSTAIESQGTGTFNESQSY